MVVAMSPVHPNSQPLSPRTTTSWLREGPLVQSQQSMAACQVPLFLNQPLWSSHHPSTLVFLQQWFARAAYLDVQLTALPSNDVEPLRTQIQQELVERWANQRPRRLHALPLPQFLQLLQSPAGNTTGVNGMRLSPRLLQLLESLMLPIEQQQPSGSFTMTTHATRWSAVQQVLALSLQLHQDLSLPTHKYLAHQLALLYQALGALGPQCSLHRYKSDIEGHFDTIKDQLKDPKSDPVLSGNEQAWLFQLTQDIAKTTLALDKTICGEKVSTFVANIQTHLRA